MSSASPGASHRKPTRRPGRKAPTLRPDPNTSGTVVQRVLNIYIYMYIYIYIYLYMYIYIYVYIYIYIYVYIYIYGKDSIET